MRQEFRQEERVDGAHARSQQARVRVRRLRRQVQLQNAAEKTRSRALERNARVSDLRRREAVQGKEGSRPAHGHAQGEQVRV